ncbi:MAG: hypothetical protein B9S33_00300 [Pedosphaera sp. Tous-C6FEB]|nr:MAG: hypothetical protein B9S33_00300 [Pedosphaera sp. Tous-C6FEB]
MKACLTALYLCAVSCLFLAWAAEPKSVDGKAPGPRLDLTPVTNELENAQAEYRADARTNHIVLGLPLYTNAPFSEARLRAAALAGSGLAASMCSDSNSLDESFLLRLSATNGWMLAQLRLAKELEEQAVQSFEFRSTNGRLFKVTGPLGAAEAEFKAAVLRDYPGAVFVRATGRPKHELAADLASAKQWREAANKSLPVLRAKAATNDAEAMYGLGALYWTGTLVESNRTIGLDLLRRAAEKELAPAQYALASELASSNHRNFVEAAAWYQRAATQGLAKAQAALFVLNDEPQRWRHDLRFHAQARERVRWAYEFVSQPTKSWAAYNACKNIGEAFLQGQGVAQDSTTACLWFRRAIDLGVNSNGGLAEIELALCYFGGDGVPQSDEEGLRWSFAAKTNGYSGEFEGWVADGAIQAGDWRKAFKYMRKLAVKGDARAQANLGRMYSDGNGIEKDQAEAVKWWRKAADKDEDRAQFELGRAYFAGAGVDKDYAEAAKWYRKAANQDLPGAQNNLGFMYFEGKGVERDYGEAYAWLNLAARADRNSAANRDAVEGQMTPQQVAEAQKRTKELRTSIEARLKDAPLAFDPDKPYDRVPRTTGTGFFISEDGYFITNQHVAGEGAKVRLVTGAGSISAKVVKVDAFGGVLQAVVPSGVISAKVVKVDKANDLALLKAEGKFTALPVITSRGVRLGATAATVGFPNTGLQGFAPKLARGEIASLAGAQDDARHFQISAPIQPGNSGGALVDERGNVIGVVVAKLSQRAALATSGALAENVNYAVKSSYLLSFLESVPEVAPKLKEAHTKERKFEDVVKAVEQATVLVLVY